jgi:hypothetical protein
MLYFTSGITKLECASLAQTAVTSSDVSKRELYGYVNASGCLNFHTLCTVRHHHLDAIFHIRVCGGSTVCNSLLSAAGIRVATRNVQIGSSHKTLLSAAYASAARSVRKERLLI